MFTVFLFILYIIIKYVFLYIITFKITFFNYLLLYLINFSLTSASIIINIKLLLNNQRSVIILYIYFSNYVLIFYRIFNYKKF